MHWAELDYGLSAGQHAVLPEGKGKGKGKGGHVSFTLLRKTVSSEIA